MNVQRPIRKLSSRLTRKYQATIPQPIRDALGLKAGDLVSFVLDDDGNAVLRRATNDVQRAERAEQLAQGIREARRKFADENILPEGMTSGEWFELMRGPAAEA